jgi:chromosome segregation ATPase
MTWELWLATALNAVFIFFFGVIIKEAVGWVKKLFNEVRGYRRDIREARDEISGFGNQLDEKVTSRVQGILSAICSLEENVERNSDSLQRTVAHTAMVIRLRKKEITQILGEQREIRSEMAKTREDTQRFAKLSQHFDAKITKLESNLVEIGGDKYIIKTNNGGK